jgi:hypothetical protein
LVRGILERYPKATGVLCDLPSVLANADEVKGSSVATRCELVGVDMFQALPAGGDAYLLKMIMHDWNDAEAIQILRNCRQAIATTISPSSSVFGGRVLPARRILETRLTGLCHCG